MAIVTTLEELETFLLSIQEAADQAKSFLNILFESQYSLTETELKINEANLELDLLENEVQFLTDNQQVESIANTSYNKSLAKAQFLFDQGVKEMGDQDNSFYSLKSIKILNSGIKGYIETITKWVFDLESLSNLEEKQTYLVEIEPDIKSLIETIEGTKDKYQEDIAKYEKNEANINNLIEDSSYQPPNKKITSKEQNEKIFFSDKQKALEEKILFFKEANEKIKKGKDAITYLTKEESYLAQMKLKLTSSINDSQSQKILEISEQSDRIAKEKQELTDTVEFQESSKAESSIQITAIAEEIEILEDKKTPPAVPNPDTGLYKFAEFLPKLETESFVNWKLTAYSVSSKKATKQIKELGEGEEKILTLLADIQKKILSIVEQPPLTAELYKEILSLLKKAEKPLSAKNLSDDNDPFEDGKNKEMTDYLKKNTLYPDNLEEKAQNAEKRLEETDLSLSKKSGDKAQKEAEIDSLVNLKEQLINNNFSKDLIPVKTSGQQIKSYLQEVENYASETLKTINAIKKINTQLNLLS